MKKSAVLLLLVALVPFRAAALNTSDLLSLVAMPLAVAAVSNLTGVSQDQLGTLVSSLNQADVAPTQFVEVVRYVPVTLVQTDQYDFVQWVQTQVGQGVTGDQLVQLIAQQLQTNYNLTPQITVSAPALITTTPAPLQPVYNPAPQVVVVDQNYIPPVVRTRVEEYRTHPHGGPPGQIKKQLGLQTGAQVVHGTRPGPSFREGRAGNKGKHSGQEVRVMQQEQPQPIAVAQPIEQHGRGPGGGGPPGLEKKGGGPPGQQNGGPPGQQKKDGGGGPPGQEKKDGQKGGGKGHGKD